MADLVFDSFAGGMDDYDPESLLGSDQCVLAENVDFWTAPCGSRRLGSQAISISLGLSGASAITFLFRHLPTIDETASELWAWGVTTGVSSSLQYKDTAWNTVTFADAPALTAPSVYQMQAETNGGKLFICYDDNGVNRMHVRDVGTQTLRRAGLIAPTLAPTAVDNGSGTFSGTRYYRDRFIVKSGSAVLRRSEPSPVLTFSPSGSGSGASVTRSALINEGETHWELEAALDNANFYVIATTVIATTSVIDTAPSTTGYNIAGNLLSEDIGNYSLIPGARFIISDQDRLLFGASFSDSSKAAHVWWTPVATATGVGNNERIPVETANEIDLGGTEGGPMTGFGGPLNGTIFGFKTSHIYRLIRTGQLDNAYQPLLYSPNRGALPGSIVSAVDQAGAPAVYFLDPKIGPCRLGTGGLLRCGLDIWNTWQRVNRSATLRVAAAIFYPDREQVHWWVAADGNNTPTLRIMLQINNTQVLGDGVRRGWTRHTGASAQALSTCLYANNVDAGVARSLQLVPLMAIGNTIQQLGVGTTDNGFAFVPQIITAPRFQSSAGNESGLLQKFGVRAGTLVADADPTSTINVTLQRNFGVETVNMDVNMTPVSAETSVIKELDNLFLSECKSVQLVFKDGLSNSGTWRLQQLALVTRDEESQ